MDYLSTCRISRQITILHRNPKRSSNRLTKKKMQLLSLSFEKVFAPGGTKIRQICSRFFSFSKSENNRETWRKKWGGCGLPDCRISQHVVIIVWESLLCTLYEANFRQICSKFFFLQIAKNQETWRRKQKETMNMDLPECRIFRQIAILRRNSKRSSNRLTTKKKTQTLSLLFEKVLFALDETNFRQICSNFFFSKLQKIKRKNRRRRRIWIIWVSDFSTDRNFAT